MWGGKSIRPACSVRVAHVVLSQPNRPLSRPFRLDAKDGGRTNQRLGSLSATAPAFLLSGSDGPGELQRRGARPQSRERDRTPHSPGFAPPRLRVSIIPFPGIPERTVTQSPQVLDAPWRDAKPGEASLRSLRFLRFLCFLWLFVRETSEKRFNHQGKGKTEDGVLDRINMMKRIGCSRLVILSMLRAIRVHQRASAASTPVFLRAVPDRLWKPWRPFSAFVASRPLRALAPWWQAGIRSCLPVALSVADRAGHGATPVPCRLPLGRVPARRRKSRPDPVRPRPSDAEEGDPRPATPRTR